MAALGWLLNLGFAAGASASDPSAALTGTVTDSLTERHVADGGRTIILTLTDDTWVASGAVFDAQRQNIINGLDSAQSETTGWNTEVRDKLDVTAVVRTSDTVVTITLTASSSYNISADETITATVPATAVSSSTELTATPTFAVQYVTAAGLVSSRVIDRKRLLKQIARDDEEVLAIYSAIRRKD